MATVNHACLMLAGRCGTAVRRCLRLSLWIGLWIGLCSGSAGTQPAGVPEPAPSARLADTAFLTDQDRAYVKAHPRLRLVYVEAPP